MRRKYCALLMLAALTVSRAAAAQDNKSDDRENEQSCERAMNTVARSEVEEEDRWAFNRIRRCPGAAGALASIWRSPPKNTSVLHDLVAASRSLADHRILVAVHAVASDGRMSQAIRRVAVDVVLGQYNPTLSLLKSAWTKPATSVLAQQEDYYHVRGEQPVTAADRQQVIQTFVSIGTTDPDPVAKKVLGRIGAELSRP